MLAASVADPSALWEPQPGETAKAFAAFCAFRDLPPERRTVPAAFQALHGRPSGGHGGASQWRLWRSKNAWDARVDAWDREQDRVAQAEFQRARKQALVGCTGRCRTRRWMSRRRRPARAVRRRGCGSRRCCRSWRRCPRGWRSPRTGRGDGLSPVAWGSPGPDRGPRLKSTR